MLFLTERPMWVRPNLPSLFFHPLVLTPTMTKTLTADQKAKRREAHSRWRIKNKEKIKAKNAKDNPKNNAKNNAKTAKALRLETERLTKECAESKEAILSPEERSKIVQEGLDLVLKLPTDSKFVHVFVGASDTSMAQMRKESFAGSSGRGYGIPSVVNTADGTFASFQQVEDRLTTATGK